MRGFGGCDVDPVEDGGDDDAPLGGVEPFQPGQHVVIAASGDLLDRGAGLVGEWLPVAYKPVLHDLAGSEPLDAG